MDAHSRAGSAAVVVATIESAEPLAIICADGWRLSASLIRPATPVRAVLVVNSAMGVPHRIYLAFARFLARNGIATLLYDYRGIAGSATPSLRGFLADVLDWARLDFPAAIAAARQECPDRPLVLLGHSIGGQLFGLDRVKCKRARIDRCRRTERVLGSLGWNRARGTVNALVHRHSRAVVIARLLSGTRDRCWRKSAAGRCFAVGRLGTRSVFICSIANQA